MQKQVALIVIALAFFALWLTPVQAQSAEPRVDLVGQFALQRSPRDSFNDNWNPGGGGVFTFNLNKHIGIEAAVFSFGKGRPVLVAEIDDIPEPELQGVFGVKAGVRKN